MFLARWFRRSRPTRTFRPAVHPLEDRTIRIGLYIVQYPREKWP
jgi:hypothetical protein